MENFSHPEGQSQEQNITPEMSVQDIMNRWPKTIPVFIQYRTNCVGCNMAAFETLEDAANIYHLCLEHFVRDLENATQDTEQSS